MKTIKTAFIVCIWQNRIFSRVKMKQIQFLSCFICSFFLTWFTEFWLAEAARVTPSNGLLCSFAWFLMFHIHSVVHSCVLLFTWVNMTARYSQGIKLTMCVTYFVPWSRCCRSPLEQNWETVQYGPLSCWRYSPWKRVRLSSMTWSRHLSRPCFIARGMAPDSIGVLSNTRPAPLCEPTCNPASDSTVFPVDESSVLMEGCTC